MDIFETRRKQLTELVDVYTQGNLSVFAERFGYSRAQISQYLSETYNDGRSMGERAARALEKKLGLHQGFLDEIPKPLSKPPVSSRPDRGNRRIQPRFMVTGTKEMRGFVDLVNIPADDERVRLELPSASDSAFGLAVYGSGLRPRAKSGEFLIVDPAVAPSPGDDVFLRLDPTQNEAPNMVVQFLYQKDQEMTFGHLNESGPSLSISLNEVQSVETIIAILSQHEWDD